MHSYLLFQSSSLLMYSYLPWVLQCTLDSNWNPDLVQVPSRNVGRLKKATPTLKIEPQELMQEVKRGREEQAKSGS